MNFRALLEELSALFRRTRQARRQSDPLPGMRATKQEIFQRLAVYLCVALSCIAVLFASCAKAPAEDAPAESAVTETVR